MLPKILRKERGREKEMEREMEREREKGREGEGKGGRGKEREGGRGVEREGGEEREIYPLSEALSRERSSVMSVRASRMGAGCRTVTLRRTLLTFKRVLPNTIIGKKS